MKTTGSESDHLKKYTAVSGNRGLILIVSLVLIFIIVNVVIVFDANQDFYDFRENSAIVKVVRDLDSSINFNHREVYTRHDSLSLAEQGEHFLALVKQYEYAADLISNMNAYERFGFDTGRITPDIDSMKRYALALSDFSSSENAQSLLYFLRYFDHRILDAFHDLDRTIRSTQREKAARLNYYYLQLLAVSSSACLLAVILIFLYTRVRRNLAERLRMQEELNAEKNKYRNLAESMDDAVLITDKEGIVVFANSAVEKVTGYTPAELTGRVSYKTLTDSVTWSSSESRLNDRLAGRSEEFFSRIIRKDGTPLRVYIKGSPFRDHNGMVIGSIGVISDLSDQLRMEREATIHRENLIGVIENSTDFIWAFDQELRLTVYNSAFKREFKNLFHAETKTGMQILDYVGEVQKRAWQRICRKALKGERVRFDQKYEIDGEQRVYSVALNPLKDQEGMISGIACFMSDITSRVKNEEELRAAMITAEEATRLKTEFLANMSHEIRTPLNGILGMANLLIDTELNEYQRLYANSIKESGSSLLGILNDILDISKVEAGKIEIFTEEFDLPNLVEALAEIYSVQAESKNISFYIESSLSVPQRIRCDRLRLNQILSNILNNAFKFTETGYVNLAVRAEITDELSGIMHFTVEDTGPGMNDDTLASIFTEYAQANAAVVRKFGGTGLGLSISKKLAELMGGTITVVSEPGRGSSFMISLPFTLSQKYIPPSLPQQNGRVLVVTNENKGGDIIAGLLSAIGYTPVVVFNAANALVRLTRAAQDGSDFEFILCNYTLPGYDGFSLLKQIKENYPRHPALFILIGRKKLAPLKSKITAAGIMPLAKPFCMRSLMQMLEVLHPAERKQQVRTVAENIRRLKILIADDNRINRTVLTGFLQKLGHDVTETSDGQEALSAYMSDTFDMIMLDCQMPVLDGYQVSRRIRESEGESGKRIPVIGVTANSGHDEKERCLAAGMDDFLVKPFEISDLRRTVELNTVQSQVEEYSDSGFEINNPQITSLRESLDNETVDELLELFLNDFQNYLGSLSVRIEAGNFNGLSAESHTIKSGCANIGAEKLRKLVDKLEQESDKSSRSEIRALFNKLADEYIYVKQKIKNYITLNG